MIAKDKRDLAFAGMLCPVRNINKNGRRNRRKDSTQKFYMNCFTNGVSNSLHTFRICSLLRNDSFAFLAKQDLKFSISPGILNNPLAKKPVMKMVNFELCLGFKWLPRLISKFSPCIIL